MTAAKRSPWLNGHSPETPHEWLAGASTCAKCVTYAAVMGEGVTAWICGNIAPVRVGWYERLFTDGVCRHWWSGAHWSAAEGGAPHWRDVGDYPCWRGLQQPAATAAPGA